MLKAITLWQPYASLMALGKKRNETRSRLTHFRGDLAICSAKQSPKGTLAKMMIKPFRAALGIDEITPDAPNIIDLTKHFPGGFVLAVVELYACVEASRITHGGEFVDRVNADEFAFGDYSDGNMIWFTRNPRRLATPVPVRGGQFLFNLPPDVEAKVRAQI